MDRNLVWVEQVSIRVGGFILRVAQLGVGAVQARARGETRLVGAWFGTPWMFVYKGGYLSSATGQLGFYNTVHRPCNITNSKKSTCSGTDVVAQQVVLLPTQSVFPV